MASHRNQAFEAVMHGTLEEVRDALTLGVDPSAFRGTKCLLVRALEHPDPTEATARAKILLEAGAQWNPSGNYTPWRTVFSRRLKDLIPVFAQQAGALTQPVRQQDYLPAGCAAQEQWDEGLRILDSLGVDIRHSQHLPTRNPSFTCTLETWLSFSEYHPPQDLNHWLKTVEWLMAKPLLAEEMPAARQGVLNALGRMERKKFDHVHAFVDLFQANPVWFDDTCARVMVSKKIQAMSHAKTSKEANALWEAAMELTERQRLSLSPGDIDHHFKPSPLEELLKLASKHRRQPKLLKKTVERIGWALDHGATPEDHTRGKPAWYEALRRTALPYQALIPLVERGLDLTKPVAFSLHLYLIDNEVNHIQEEKGYTAAELLLHTHQESFEELVRGSPNLVNQRDQHGKTLLMQLAERDFLRARGGLGWAYDTVLLLQSLGARLEDTDAEGNNFLLLLMSNHRLQPDDAARVVMYFHASLPGLLIQPNTQGKTPVDAIRKNYSHTKEMHAFLNALELSARLPPVTATGRPISKRF